MKFLYPLYPYPQFGGNISTISRAVMILGFDTVRNLAVTLILLEHMQNRHQAGQLRDEVIRALFNSIMTRRLLASSGGGDNEEGFICGVFFNLGRLLVMYYLHDEWVDIENRMRAGAPEQEAAQAVIGLFYGDRLQANSLAIEVATMNMLKTLRNQAVLAFKQR